jgi:hypothetical protein
MANRLKDVKVYVQVWVVWLMAIHAYTKFKVKMNVTLCQTINEMTDWQRNSEIRYRKIFFFVNDTQ